MATIDADQCPIDGEAVLLGSATLEGEKSFMQQAIAEAEEGVLSGGGPFGAVVVKDGEVVAFAHNEVVPSLDPTAHAEVNAIRKACKKLKTFSLEGCVLYTSCYPCMMCHAAIHWARIGRVFYGNSALDAQGIGFDDVAIWDDLLKPSEGRLVQYSSLCAEEAKVTFQKWEENLAFERY